MNLLSKRDFSTPLQIAKDEATISNGSFLTDNAIKYSLKEKENVHVIEYYKKREEGAIALQKIYKGWRYRTYGDGVLK